MKKILLGVMIMLSMANATIAEKNVKALINISENILKSKCNSMIRISEEKKDRRLFSFCNNEITISKETSVVIFKNKCKNGTTGFFITYQNFNPFELITYDSCEDNMTVIQ